MKRFYLCVCSAFTYSVHMHKPSFTNCPPPQIDDKIYKQEIRYLPSGESSTGKVWQFNHLTSVDEQYELTYTGNDSPLMDTKHRTRYTYRVVKDSLLKTEIGNISTYQKAIYPKLRNSPSDNMNENYRDQNNQHMVSKFSSRPKTRIGHIYSPPKDYLLLLTDHGLSTEL
jgi:hypothetical protein